MATGQPTTAAAAAAAAEPEVTTADRRGDTGQLIDKLASRAVEAQQLLEALRGSK